MFAWADPIFDGLAAVLAWFYSLVPDYTFAICMLTLAIMLLFTPLTLKGARSMTKMQALQPEMTQLRKQHGGDRQKLNEEMMKLYQSNGVSPLGGCLPNLVQIPIFIVLYRVILNLRVTPDSPHFYNDPSNPDSYPRNLSQDTGLFDDLVAAISDGFGEMRSLGMDLAQSAREVVQADFVDGLPYLALVGVTFVLAWLQQRQMARRRGNSAMPNRQMEIMMKYLPFMLPVFSFFVPAALVPYFIVSSIYRMLTQAFIHATMKPPKPLVESNSAGGVIEAETVPEPEPEAPRQVPNQRSRKALDAEAARRAERERRSTERRAVSRDPASEPAPQPAPTEPVEPPAVRRTRSSGERVDDARKRARRGARSSSRDQTGGRGRKRRRAEPEPETRPIQSRRTSGDGKTRNRRKR
ncbi:YidC/Oxa1 family membrane protein insertase [Candidatus Poriferisodalis sp.]|uniref:YidC/Oxa1 family membrane protein insertase n=1 Tax=Candidatus Poriferisodalis sp. TaxID=3101277 RepID=UPI003B0214E9